MNHEPDGDYLRITSAWFISFIAIKYQNTLQYKLQPNANAYMSILKTSNDNIIHTVKLNLTSQKNYNTKKNN